jgi:hypothetical protein
VRRTVPHPRLPLRPARPDPQPGSPPSPGGEHAEPTKVTAAWPPPTLLDVRAEHRSPSAPRRRRRPSRSRHRVPGRRRARGWRRTTGPLAALVVAVAAGVFVAATVDDAGRRQEAWGEVLRVAVATRDLEPGHVVEPDDVLWVQRPIGALPFATDGADPTGRLVVARVVGGETFAPVRLAPTGVHGLAARVPPHHVAVAVPTDARTPPLEAEQAVDLYATTEDASSLIGATSTDRRRSDPGPEGSSARDGEGGGVGGTPAARRLAHRAVVVQVDDRQVTVAVADAEAGAVAQALIGGTVIVALTAP